MLHEIFKGMDNASEVINENFQNGSIVEHNLDEENPGNGYYVRYGNGLQLCFHKITTPNLSTSNGIGALYRSDAQYWSFPKPFTQVINFDVSVSQAGWKRWGMLLNEPTITNGHYAVAGVDNTTLESTIHLSAIGFYK